MAMAPEVGTARVFVVVNARSGNSSPEEVRKVWESHQAKGCAESRIHEPVEGEDILAIVREAVAQGFDTVVAAGGDGTVSAVANGLIGSEATARDHPAGHRECARSRAGDSDHARWACVLLNGPNTTTSIDAMKVKNKHYFTQIGIGVDAVMIRDTTVEHKRWLGNGAYIWTAATRFIGFQRHRFSIAADDRARTAESPSGGAGQLWQPGYFRTCAGVPTFVLMTDRSTFVFCGPRTC